MWQGQKTLFWPSHCKFLRKAWEPTLMILFRGLNFPEMIVLERFLAFSRTLRPNGNHYGSPHNWVSQCHVSGNRVWGLICFPSRSPWILLLNNQLLHTRTFRTNQMIKGSIIPFPCSLLVSLLFLMLYKRHSQWFFIDQISAREWPLSWLSEVARGSSNLSY